VDSTIVMQGAETLSPAALFIHADAVVKIVMLGLLAASVWTWAIIVSQSMRLRRLAKESARFERDFWKADDVDKFYEERGSEDLPSARVLAAGVIEWRRSTVGDTVDRDGTRSRLAAAMAATVAAEIDELVAARKRMPMVRVEGEYRFDGPAGERSLVELFEDRSQLILYRFFFEDGVDGCPDAGCPGCSSWADGIGQLGLLHARDITVAMASPAPQESLRRYAERMGWTHIPWYTIRTGSFSTDFGVAEWFGLNVFLRLGQDIYRTYFFSTAPWSA